MEVVDRNDMTGVAQGANRVSVVARDPLPASHYLLSRPAASWEGATQAPMTQRQSVNALSHCPAVWRPWRWEGRRLCCKDTIWDKDYTRICVDCYFGGPVAAVWSTVGAMGTLVSLLLQEPPPRRRRPAVSELFILISPEVLKPHDTTIILLWTWVKAMTICGGDST